MFDDDGGGGGIWDFRSWTREQKYKSSFWPAYEVQLRVCERKIKEKGRRYLVTVIMRERIFMRAFYRPIEFAHRVWLIAMFSWWWLHKLSASVHLGGLELCRRWWWNSKESAGQGIYGRRVKTKSRVRFNLGQPIWTMSMCLVALHFARVVGSNSELTAHPFWFFFFFFFAFFWL